MMGSVERKARKVRCEGKAMTAIVLAGGRGSRMKADKAELAVGGRTLLERVLGQLEPYFEEILVSVSPGQAPRLTGPVGKRPASRAIREASNRTSSPRVVEDETPGLGPLGGILAGLKAATNDACAVIACDIPEIDLPLLRSLARAAGGTEIAVPTGPAGHYEPLFAVYRRSVVPEIDLPLLRSLARAAGGTEIAVPTGPAGHYEPLFAVYRRPVVPEIEKLLRTNERSILPLYDRCRTAVIRFKEPGRLRNLNTRADYESYLRELANREGHSKKTKAIGPLNSAPSRVHPREKKRTDQRPGRATRP